MQKILNLICRSFILSSSCSHILTQKNEDSFSESSHKQTHNTQNRIVGAQYEFKTKTNTHQSNII